MDIVMNILIAMLAFSFVIFFHELCHFLMAKALKIEAKEFAVGFGKSFITYQQGKVWFLPSEKKGTYDKNKMSYHLKVLPFGGYVMFDRNEIKDGKVKQEHYFNSFHPFKRILVLLAGPAGNLLLGLGIFFLFFAQNVEMGPSNEIQAVTESSFAQKMGLQENDLLLSVNGSESFSIKEIENGLKQVDFCIEYERGGSVQTVCQTPENNMEKIGVTMGIPASMMVAEGVKMYGQVIKQYVISFTTIIINLEIEQLNGPIGVLDAVQESVPVWNDFLIMMITVNVALGVANLLLPLTITDGGRIAADLIAWARRKQSIDLRYMNIASVLIIITLFATTTFLDIQRILEKLGWL